MNNKTFIEMNRTGWNELIKSNKPFANTILPEYGPFLKRNEEGSEIITKGPDKISLAQKNLMISTMINEAKKAGFYVDMILEEETVLKDDVNGYKSIFWRKEKTINCPSTIIYKFKRTLKS